MKNVVISILACAIVGLCAYIVGTNQGAGKSAGEQYTAAPAPPNQPAPVKNLRAPAPPPPNPADYRASLLPDADAFDAEKEEAAMQQLQKANELIRTLAEENQALAEKTAPSLAKGLQQILEAPEIKEMMKSGMPLIQQQNADLFRKLNLNEDQQTAMTELMVQNGVDQLASGITMLSGNFEASSSSMVAAREKTHRAIRDQFGGDVLAEYQQWEDSRNERQSVQQFNRALGEAGLDEDTMDQLVGMLHDRRGEFADLEHLSKPENFHPADLDEEARASVLSQVEQLHDLYLRDATTLLSQDQLDVLQSTLGTQRQQLNGMLKGAYNMFQRAQNAQ